MPDLLTEPLFPAVPEEAGFAPTMKQKPKAQVVDQGQTVTFECTIQASPKPEVR
jgi:hypothetical protein